VKDRKLTPKEKAFCFYYLGSGDAVKAVKSAGYKKNFENRARELLSRADVREELLALCKLNSASSREFARCGFERLAFGSISDAVSLLYLEKPTRKELQEMDLFCISEIKKPKDGSVEIKFFDRLKALQQLFEEQKVCEQKTESPIMEAIAAGALALSQRGAEDGD